MASMLSKTELDSRTKVMLTQMQEKGLDHPLFSFYVEEAAALAVARRNWDIMQFLVRELQSEMTTPGSVRFKDENGKVRGVPKEPRNVSGDNLLSLINEELAAATDAFRASCQDVHKKAAACTNEAARLESISQGRAK